MPTKTLKTKTTHKKTAKKSDAFVELLKADHRKVKQLFKSYENSESNPKKKELVITILTELKIHTKIEEEIVYPAFRAVMTKDESELMDEADEEHHVAKLLIHELETLEVGNNHYDAKVLVLGEVVDHHIQEEEGEMFPKAKKIKEEGIAERLKTRKEELLVSLGQPAG